MKNLKKILKVLFSLLLISTSILFIFQYDVIKRLWNTGKSYTYNDVSLCNSTDSYRIFSESEKYAEALKNARDSILTLKKKYNIPGLSICIIANDTIIWNEAFGCENIATKKATTTSTLFRVGSISKSMTGIALMKLVEEGKLNLEQTVENILPDFPKKKFSIRINELAGHQSGIRHYKGVEMLSNTPYESVENSLSIFKDNALLFEPGTNYQYSSYNYTLLGRVIEKITKSNYLDYMKNEIFEPLQMNSTIPDKKSLNSVGYSSGINSKIKNSIEVDVSNKWAGGGYLSTPKDLALMLNNLDSLLSKDSQKKLFEQQNFKNGKPTGYEYAIGFRKTILEGEPKLTLIHHGGSSVGGRAFLLKLVEDNIIVAICANSDTGMFRPNNYDLQQVYDIAKIFIPENKIQ